MAHMIIVVIFSLSNLLNCISCEENLVKDLHNENKLAPLSAQHSTVDSFPLPDLTILREATESNSLQNEKLVKNDHNILNELKVALKKVKEEVRQHLDLQDNDEVNPNSKVVSQPELFNFQEDTVNKHISATHHGESLEDEVHGKSFSSLDNKPINEEKKNSVKQTILQEVLPEEVGNGQSTLKEAIQIKDVRNGENNDSFQPKDSQTKTSEKKFLNKEEPLEELVDSKGYVLANAKREYKSKKYLQHAKSYNVQSTFARDAEDSDLYTISKRNFVSFSGQCSNDFLSFWNSIRRIQTKSASLADSDSLLYYNKSTEPELKDEAAQMIDQEVPELRADERGLIDEKNISVDIGKEKSIEDKQILLGVEDSIDVKDAEIKDQLETYSQFAERVSAEKKNGGSSTANHGTNGQNIKGTKLKSKNYASTDCGAKLLAANPEASHSHKIIHSNKDEYMLNKCVDKIWATVELCESIRPHKFDIANFELFSNSPKDIQLFGSHRYPTREWISLGVYMGEEGNRDVQSFPIETEEFFKYIKVDVLSHYGTEFFCPLSLFRIYGLSEFEVIDQLEDNGTEEEPEFFELENKEEKVKEKPGMIPNILKSMLSGVLEVIKRGSRSANESNEPEQFNIYTESCISLHVNFAIPNDSCPMANSLNYILACYSEEYQKLMQHPSLAITVQNFNFCSSLINVSCSSTAINDGVLYDTVCNNSYVCVMLSPKHILAMCHMYHPTILFDSKNCTKADELPSPSNCSITSNTFNDVRSNITTQNILGNISAGNENLVYNGTLQNEPQSTDTVANLSSIQDVSGQGEDQKEINGSQDYNYIYKATKDSQKKEKVSKPVNSNSDVLEDFSKSSGETTKDRKLEKDSVSPNVSLTEDLLLANLPHGTISPPIIPATTGAPHMSGENRVVSTSANKESIVVRLSNKIKILEQNMSISSQYLEELSRRYKRQMEEMEHQFNATIMALNETSQTAYERDLHHQKYMESLEAELVELKNIVFSLSKERDNFLSTIIEQHLILFVIEIIILFGAFFFCIRRREVIPRRKPTPVVHVNGSLKSSSGNESQEFLESFCMEANGVPSYIRRRSVDSIQDANETKIRLRRLSGDVQNVSGSYIHLLKPPIVPSNSEEVSKEKKRKKRKTSLKRSHSNSSIHEKVQSHSVVLSKNEKRKQEKIKRSSAGVLFSVDLNEDQRVRTRVEELESKEEEGWSRVQNRRSSKVKGDKDLDFYFEKSDPENYLKNGFVNQCSNYSTTELNNLENVNPFDCGTNDQAVVGKPVFALPMIDYNAPAVKSYYHSFEDPSVYSTFDTVDLETDDQLTPIWTADPESRSLKKVNALSDFSKLIPSCSNPIKGKTKLRSDNWHWFSSQTSSIVMDSRSATTSEGILSPTEGVVKGKTSSGKVEKRKKKKNKTNKLSVGRC